MSREDVLKSPSYWTTALQIDIYNAIVDALERKGISKDDFIKEFGVAAHDVLDGDYDGDLGYLVKMCVFCGIAPKIEFPEIETLF